MRSSPPERRVRAVSALLAALAALASPAAVSAFPTGPVKAADFASSGVLVPGGRAVELSGPVRCWKGGHVRLRATISERSTRTRPGAIAQGFWSGTCAGKAQTWHLIAAASSGTTLRAGCANAAGLVIYARGGETIDTKQWLTTITLTDPGKASAHVAC